MQEIFTNKTIIEIIVLIIRLLFPIAIYFKGNFENKRKRNLFTFLAYLFPIITAIICIKKYTKSIKDVVIILFILVFSLVSLFSIGIAYNNSQKYYDQTGSKHINDYSIIFTDSEGNQYSFDFDKSGYDKLYINNSDEYLTADLCFIDEKGYLVYDEDCSIIVKDNTCCVDTDGEIYYPAKYAKFSDDGSLIYDFGDMEFSYDRFGNAYTYSYVPYFDAKGNKYLYSFDSSTQKGTYINVNTKDAFDNEYSFVDESGYFIYDNNQEFEQIEEITNAIEYKDSNGKIYYWASGVSWNEKGELMNSFGERITR